MKKFLLILLVAGCFGIPFAQAGSSPVDTVQKFVQASQRFDWEGVAAQIVGGDEAQITTPEEAQMAQVLMAIFATAKIQNVQANGNQATVLIEISNPETGESTVAPLTLICVNGEWKINLE